MSKVGRNILQVGLGAFGQHHIRAWHMLGVGANYRVADLDSARLQRAAEEYKLSPEQLSTDFHRFIGEADIVDIVTPTDRHFDVCMEALRAGKDVFIEKPMTMTLAEAEDVHRLARERSRILQVGYYYRYHPAAKLVKQWLGSRSLGDLRYAAGSFMGFKRARTDVGVTHTDGVHFIDLFNWWLDAAPDRVFAVTRDHFSRGLEDWSLVVLEYPGGTVARVESGYIQPGRWPDKVVPNAVTTKDVYLCGSTATAEIDFEQDRLQLHRVHHELRNGIWTPVMEGTDTTPSEPTTPVQMVAAELSSFMDSVENRREPEANTYSAGCVMAGVVEAIYRSARTGMPAEVAVREAARA